MKTWDDINQSGTVPLLEDMDDDLDDSDDKSRDEIEMTRVSTQQRNSLDDSGKVTDVCDLIGPFGLYQKLFTFWVCYLSYLGAISTMDITFMAPDLNFTCLDPGFELSDDQCKMVVNVTTHVTMEKTCTTWNYTTDSSTGPTLTEKFNLVCDREWYISLASSMQQVGDLVAGFTVSYISDKYGRRPVCVISLIPGAIALIMFIFVTNIEWFIAAKFIYGFSGQSVNYLAMIILVELTVEKYRGFVSILGVTIGYSSGYVSLPGLYWLIRDERNFHILLVVMCGSLLAFYWAIPESPRWLLVKDRNKECLKLIKWIRKLNGLETNEKQLEVDLEKIGRQIKIQSTASNRVGSNVFDLFRAKEIRKRTIIIFFCWFICNLIYFAVALMADVFGGDPYWNVFFLAFIELPSCAFCLITERYFGHRTLLVGGLVITGLVYFANIAVPNGYHLCQLIMVVLAKFWVNSSYNFVYPYTNELFPTTLRSTGVGLAGGMASLGGVFSPYVNQLVKATSVSVVFGIFGVLSIISASSIMFLPETKFIKLPDTLCEI